MVSEITPAWVPPGSRFRRRLTDDEIQSIGEAAKKGGSLAGFNTLWDFLLQEGEKVTLAQATECRLRYHVRDYAIPSDQDTAIQRLLSVSPSRESRRRWSRRRTGMTFLFYGPATFDDIAMVELEEDAG